MGLRRNGSKCLFLMALRILIVSLGILVFLKSPDAHTRDIESKKRIRNLIEGVEKSQNSLIQGENLHSFPLLRTFYQQRYYKLAWSNPKRPGAQVYTFLRFIYNTDKEGLRSEDYHLSAIKGIIKKYRHQKYKKSKPDHNLLIDLDLLLTDAFFTLSSHIRYGRIYPDIKTLKGDKGHQKENLIEILQNSLAPEQLKKKLKTFFACSPGYLKLLNVLIHYRTIAKNGGWPIVPNYSKILYAGRKNRLKKSPRRSLTRKKFIEILCERLIAAGDLNARYGADHDEYENTIKEAVRRFQHRHGLKVDGIVGPATLKTMNVPVEERIRQIALNLKRYRWVHQDLGKRYIFINIANYELSAVENDKTVLAMRVVVGKIERPTPVFSDTMTYLVFNPYWYIPNTIATEDLFPLVQQDPTLLAKKNIKIIQGIGKKAMELDPLNIEMIKANFSNYTFKFRQDPGPQNPLGKVKFMLPNKFGVYIHDTTSRQIFLKNKRTFSSGCIRIENPLGLAEFVLRGDQKWDRHQITVAIEKGERQKVALPQPIPVHIVYLTAWADENGTVQFRNDIYQNDKRAYEIVKSPTESSKNCSHIAAAGPSLSISSL